MSLNKVLLIGNVGKDPEVRYLNNGNPGDQNAKVATFTLATTERYRDRVSGEMKEMTEWHNIVTWRSLADRVERFVKKGSQIFIEGHLRTRNWTDQSGQTHYTTEVIADNLQLLGKRPDNPSAQYHQGPQQGGRPAQDAWRQGQPNQDAWHQGQAGSKPSEAPEAASRQNDGSEVDDLPF